MFGYGYNNTFLYVILVIMVITNLLNGGFNLVSLLLTLPGVFIALTFHEFAHAYAADKLGDYTPRRQCRLNLNPLSHIDPFGFVMLLFAGIGWGKPVEINPRNFDRKVSMTAGEAIVAFAGPLMNMLLALVFTIVFYAVGTFAPTTFTLSQVGIIVMTILQSIVFVNIGLGVFNLIPLPPLDGSKIVMHFLPYNAKVWVQDHMQLFYIIFLIIWITPIASMIISPAIQGIAAGLNAVVGGVFQLF